MVLISVGCMFTMVVYDVADDEHRSVEIDHTVPSYVGHSTAAETMTTVDDDQKIMSDIVAATLPHPRPLAALYALSLPANLAPIPRKQDLQDMAS